MGKNVFVLLLAMGCSLVAHAQQDGFRAFFKVDEGFDVVKENVELAITEQGLVIAHHSDVGTMLARTAADLGAKTPVYDNGVVIEFCSASLSRQMMETDPSLIIFCPYGIAVYTLPSQPGTTHITYLRYSELGPQHAKEALLKIEKLLDDIVQQAIDW